MMSRLSVGLTGAILVAFMFLIPENSHAATGYATFESFYRSSSAIMWLVAGVFAIFAGALIFFTGGTASPIAVGTGSWIGGLMGYSGIAATNAGLALLGGGSIAAGGFGVIGGTALLTVALSFGTSVVFDFAANKAVDAYDYSKFASQSKTMTTLPFPKNSDGSDAYEAAMEVLESINDTEPVSTSKNQEIVSKAIQELSASTGGTLTDAEKSREASLLALLNFVRNDYFRAKEAAENAYRLAANEQVKATLPAFIIASSTLYEEAPDVKRVMDYFSYSIKNESDNPITPLLFAILLDRAMYRFNDGYLTSKSLMEIYDVSRTLPYDERLAMIQLGLVARYFVRTKMEQQKILSLTRSENKAIKESPKTLTAVKAALAEHKSLISANKIAIDEQGVTLDDRLNSNISLWDKLFGEGIQAWETQWREKLNEMQFLRLSYSQGVSELEAKVLELERYQAKLVSKEQPPVTVVAAAPGIASPWLSYLAFFFGLVIAVMLAFRLKRVK